MDILKFGADCEVIGPAELKQRVAAEVRKMTAAIASVPDVHAPKLSAQVASV